MYLRGTTDSFHVFIGPLRHRPHDRHQAPARPGQMVLVPRGMRLIKALLQQTVRNQALEAIGEDIRGDGFGGILEILVAVLAEQADTSNQEQGPLVTDDIQSGGNRALRVLRQPFVEYFFGYAVCLPGRLR